MMESSSDSKRSLLSRVFLSPEEKRLRAGWRILLQTLILVVLFFLFGLVLSFFINYLSNQILFISQLSSLLAVTLSILIGRRLFDKRSFKSLGLDISAHALSDILAGTLISALIMGLIFLAEWAIGWLQFEGFAWKIHAAEDIIANIFVYVIIFLMVAWSEELISRGYWLQNIEDGTNTGWALLLSSSFFALGHATNPNVSPIAIFALVFAGFFLAFGYLRTRQLWLSIGLHFGWNLFEGVILGFPVSGLKVFRIIIQSQTGPVLWTGGEFGPEAGLIIVPALIIGAGLIYWYTDERRKT
ncbi:MAG: CPBP family intramembrane metalloprotease [Anaerolineales bacterium]|nr:CPBP family intramembrane metalloprotease [Anaerolineales bacterium]